MPVKALVPFLNERMLYQFQWGFRKDGRTLEQYKAWAHKELRPVLGVLAAAGTLLSFEGPRSGRPPGPSPAGP